MNMQATAVKRSHALAEPGIWLLVFGDLMIYGLMFILFALGYRQQVEVFEGSQRMLSQTFGVVNTLILLASSWFVVRGLHGVRQGRLSIARRWLLWAWLCGALFIVNKLVEYGLEVRAGGVLTSNDFFMYYYMITGFHLVHVLLGLSVLGLMLRVLRSSQPGLRELAFVESGAVFWHLVDLLWIVIFPLLYLVGVAA